ncbi:hypothetical protein KP509_27G004200 [Ceratopteris richardii]|uniref:GBF-interacting protein 1 N-terminal domain-containing protein n=1 Tax=Ceratopteris richardii TaxID=49495 RepID=A0A8T2REZ1_CERRI|nr:hypothetical protein KP509_27G004200 [Ceratopteris richardii]KAH7294520.1 hypothetical protein KP509_27G004200 [Ceratopteris richardii]
MRSSKGSAGAVSGAPSNSSHDHTHGVPAAAKKVVQNLREIVKKHSDEEIYAALKECDMDPDRAVHVLMNQDTFHEVRRRRVKRRENGTNFSAEEGKSKSSTSASRIEHGGKMTSFASRALTDDGSGGENLRIRSTQKDGLPNDGESQTQNQTRNTGVSRGLSYTDSLTQSTGESQMKLSRAAASESVNGSVPVAPRMHQSVHASSGPGHWTPKRQEKPRMGSDKVDPKENREAFDTDIRDTSVLNSMRRYSTSMYAHKVVPTMRSSAGSFGSMRVRAAQPYQTSSGKERTSGSLPSRSFQNQENYRPTFRVRQRASSFQKAFEWKPKPSTISTMKAVDSLEESQAEKDSKSPLSTVLPVSIDEPIELVSKLEGINLDEPPVIIPEHLRVPEAECTGLNFGSFGTDFELNFSNGSDDSKSSTMEDSSMNAETLPVQPSDPSMSDIQPVETSVQHHPQSLSSTSAENFTTSSDIILTTMPVAGKRTEVSKPETLTQEERHFSFISSAPEDHELSLADPQTNYPYDSSDSLRQEVTRPNFVSFADPSSSYFSPVFRPNSDVETRYQVLSSHAASKFSGTVSSMNAQTIASSQEQSQIAGIPHTTLAVGQPSMPVHAYAGGQPAGVTIPPYPANIYGYQYVPPNYAYMHTPYQASYPGNSGYLQPPIGSSFAPGSRVYPSAGSAAVKFPPPQYKIGSGTTPHAVVAAGYGSYQTAPSGFAGLNSSVSAGNTSNYDDMIGVQYKENALYTPSQQVDGSALWVQSRDVPGMQANSFYNIHGAGQHAGFLPSQQTHTHHAAGFASYSQSASGPNSHQLLQQPQALGSVGAASHAVMFSQPQRGPVNWANNYSNLIRSQ